MLNVLNFFMQEPVLMKVLFDSDASVRGRAAAPRAHLDEVCVNIHA